MNMNESVGVMKMSELSELIDFKRQGIQKVTENIIDTEIGLVELDLGLRSMEIEELKKAHEKTQEFKTETAKTAKELAKKNKTSELEEYKKLISCI